MSRNIVENWGNFYMFFIWQYFYEGFLGFCLFYGFLERVYFYVELRTSEKKIYIWLLLRSNYEWQRRITYFQHNFSNSLVKIKTVGSQRKWRFGEKIKENKFCFSILRICSKSFCNISVFDIFSFYHFW